MIQVTGIRAVVAAGVVALLSISYCASKYIGHAESSAPPWIYGNRNSRFTIVLYADLKCPYCRDYFPVLLNWIDAHEDVRLQWHHRPLEGHEPSATRDAIQRECVGRLRGNSAFWNAIAQHYSSAEYVPLPSEAFLSCLSNGAAAEWVQSQAAEATAEAVTVTPTLRLLDGETGKTLTLEGPVAGDALQSAFDLLVATPQSQERESTPTANEAGLNQP